jgi:hypothetical protein
MSAIPTIAEFAAAMTIEASVVLPGRKEGRRGKGQNKGIRSDKYLGKLRIHTLLPSDNLVACVLTGYIVQILEPPWLQIDPGPQNARLCLLVLNLCTPCQATRVSLHLQE